MTAAKNITQSQEGLQGQSGKKRAWWVWALWFVFGLILIILIGGALAWSNRYALLEDFAIDSLAQDGIEAELEIGSLTKTKAILNNVSLSYDGQVFFAAKRIHADYEWRDALEGQIKFLSLTRPRAYITVDKTGKIIDDWLPPSANESNSAGGLPENGLTITNGLFFIDSPYGVGEVTGDIELKTRQEFTAALTLKPTDIQYDEFTLSGGGSLDIDTTRDTPNLNSQITLSNLSHPAIETRNLTLSLNGTPVVDSQRFDGEIAVNFDHLETAQAFIDKSQITWDGSLTKTDNFFDLSGAWQANLKNARIPDPARSDELATTLSFYEPLSKSPIAQNFTPELRDTLASLFTGSDISARGRLARNDDGFTLNLSEPANIKSPKTTLTAIPHASRPAYYFNRQAQSITANLDAKFTNPVGLSLTDLNFKAQSINGIRLDRVDRFTAKIQTHAPWTGYGIDGRPTRLEPVIVNMAYNGTNPTNRHVDLSGAIDYGGVLPGSYVTGLKAAGDMRLTLTDTRQMTIGYTPQKTTRLHIDKLETVTDWTLYDLKGDIAPSASLFERNGIQGDSLANISLSNIHAQISHKVDAANLEVTTDALTAKGTLSNQKDTLSQNWNIGFTQALITSDDLPGPDTKIIIPTGQLKANLVTNETPDFDLTTPSANIETQLVKVDDMRLRLHGQTDNYDIEHSGGRVKLEGNPLPPLPIEGQLNVRQGTFIGTAKARLPQADNTPIAMSYNIRDGAGYADVDIAALEFSPQGLQPQSLISALRGKIAQVEGMASAKVHLEFSRGQPLQSSGTAKIINMSLGTAPGPLTGMNMELSMDSVLPLISRGRQRITVAAFDPGIPLENGVIDFELIDEGIKIFSAKWPVGDGYFSLDPFTWQYEAEENRLIMRLDDVQLSEFMESMGNDTIEATGRLQGEFPIVIAGVDVRVDKGQISVKDGGTIRYTPKDENATPPISYTQEEAIKILRTKDQARYSSLARDALREFKYKELSVKVDGALDGEVELGTVFHGSNPKVLNGQPFEFDINVVGELFNILRSFDSNAQIKSQLEKQGISTGKLLIGDE